MTLFWSESPFSRYWAFFCWRSATHFPKNGQYLENGDSDQKIVMNKKYAEFNSASFVCVTLFWSDSPFSRYWAFLEITLNISKTATRIKKRVTNKKHGKFNFASFLFVTFFWSGSPFSRYWPFFGKWVAEHQQKRSISQKRRLGSKKCYE